MSPQKSPLAQHAWPQLIVIATVKPELGLSHADQKRTRAAIRKKLRQHGIHLMTWGTLWFAFADHPCSPRDVEKQLLKWTLQSCRIRHLLLHGAYSFHDFFAQSRHLNRFTAEYFVTKLAMQLAFNVMREGDASWPVYEDLMQSLRTMFTPSGLASRLNVTFGD